MASHPLIGGSGDEVALVDAEDGRSITYAELDHLVGTRRSELADLAGGLAFLGASNDVATVIDYLALTGQGTATALLDPTTAAPAVDDWVAAYRPDAVMAMRHHAPMLSAASGPPVDEAVLLTTSGSTGSPKFVRLSAGNIGANANQISAALNIDGTERGLAHLPLFYSYGLSVLNSHLVAGATVVLSSASAIRPEFWQAVADHAVTSVPGVPYSYELFLRVGLLTMDLPTVRHLTQAGGRLATAKVLEVQEAMTPKGISMWVMYGQTEASARISVLPADELPEQAGSVGYPLPGGAAELLDVDHDGVGELVYTGPNVMLGYAAGRDDLGAGDQQQGRLHTGDLASIDESGRLWIRGRLKRIAKVFGTRVSLDDVEARLGSLGTVAAIDDGERLAVFVESGEEIEGLARRIERELAFPPRSIRAATVDALPTTAAGKVDYETLRSL